MTKLELLKLCSEFINDYTKENSEKVASIVLDGIKDSDGPGEISMKIAVNASVHMAQVSAMTVLSLLIDCGAIDLSKLDAAEFLGPSGPIS